MLARCGVKSRRELLSLFSDTSATPRDETKVPLGQNLNAGCFENETSEKNPREDSVDV